MRDGKQLVNGNTAGGGDEDDSRRKSNRELCDLVGSQHEVGEPWSIESHISSSTLPVRVPTSDSGLRFRPHSQ